MTGKVSNSERIMDACDLSNKITHTMDAYHELTLAYIKNHLIQGDSVDRNTVFKFLSGLDGLFDSIRIKSDKLQDILQNQLNRQD